MNLIELIEAADTAGAIRELGALTTDQRATWAADLASRREHMARSAWRELDYKQQDTWEIADLACQTTPEAAAAWIANFRGRYPKCGPMVDAVNLYPADWQAELVDRVAHQRLRGEMFAVVEHIIRETGCPIPTSEAFIENWLTDRSSTGDAEVKRPANVRGPKDGTNALRADDFAPTLLPLVVARPALDITWIAREIAEYADKGVIDHGLLSRRTFTDLMPGRETVEVLESGPLTPAENARLQVAFLLRDRNGTRMETKEPLTVLRSLALPPEENAAFLRDYVAMLDLSLPVADYGQESLIELDKAGLLEADVLTEVCKRILLRPEKKLVRAQLSWLDQVARREPARAGRVLTDAALVFQHQDPALQEHALDLIARHLPNAGEHALPELQAAAASLSPGHSARAAELLGLPEEAGAEQYKYTEVLPPAHTPQRVSSAETIAEVAQEAAVAVGNRYLSAEIFERALDGLVRHSRLDRDALSEALQPVLRKEPRVEAKCTHEDLYDVAATVCGGPHRSGHLSNRAFYHRLSPPEEMLRARLLEAIEVIESGTQPFLLAVPTLDTGAIDAAVLVERIAEFERLGVAPAPIDLAQALLRVDPAPDEPVLRAAEKLESDAGRQLAQWLRGGGLEHQDSTPPGWPSRLGTGANPACPGPATEPPIPPIAAALVAKLDDRNLLAEGPFVPAQLPHHRDEAAARSHGNSSGLVLSGGPAGYAVHWHVARELLCGSISPLLLLAAQGQLDGSLLGRQLQDHLRNTNRLTGLTTALRAAAETGAYATVWSVLAPILPGLQPDPLPHGAGSFLALATECAGRCGATGPIAAVEEVAGRKGSTQTIKNARLLRDVLR